MGEIKPQNLKAMGINPVNQPLPPQSQAATPTQPAPAQPESKEQPKSQAEPEKESQLSEEELAAAEQATVYDLLASLPGGPDRAQVEAWKQQFGEIFTAYFSEQEVYVFKPIRRMEWKNWMSEQHLTQNQLALQEHVVSQCVIWPPVRPEAIMTSKGGTVPTLFEQIMEYSNFIPTQAALTLVTKL